MNRELARMRKRSMQKFDLARSVLNENTTKLVTGLTLVANATPPTVGTETKKEQA